MSKGWGLALLAVAGCGSDPAATARGVSTAVARALFTQQEPAPRIRRWLLCEECTEGELDSVLVLSDSAVGPLAGALRGPPARGLENMRLQLEAMYTRTPSDSIGRAQYVSYYLANYTALYQRRAAVALDSIDTPLAREALTEALRRGGYRDDVLRVIGRSLGVTVSVDSGLLQHAPSDSFVPVNPAVLVRDAATGAELSGIPVEFRVDSGGGSITKADSITNAAGRASARWSVGSSDSINVLTASVAGRTVRFRALAYPLGLRLAILTDASDVRHGQKMVPPVRIAIQDAWGRTQASINEPGGITVNVEGTGMVAQIPVVNGVAELSELRFHGRGRVRLTARRINTPVAHSRPFNILAP